MKLNELKINPQSKRLPSLLGLLILLIGLAGGVFLIQKIRALNTKAASGASPSQIRITNVGSYSFTVSWITQNQNTGLVEFGESAKLGQSQKDTRDKERAVSEKYQTHYIVVDGLKSETKYFFKIVSSGAKYGNSDKPFEVTTGPQKVPNDNDLAQGKILTPDGNPASGAILYLSIANAITQSALTDSGGNWMIPLSTARSLDLQSFSNYDRNAQVEEIFVQGDLQTASATLTTGNDNPTPDITLGQTYNFLGQLPQTTNTPSPIRQTFTEDLSSSPSGFSSIEGDAGLTITFPSENEDINSSLPEFSGTGPKEQKLNIKIESEQEISSQINADQKGTWKWSPTVPLAAGIHKITVFYTDSQGFIKEATRSFSILATGASDLPSFTATPSGQTVTPAPKISPSITPSPTKIPSVTITPTTSASPSATISPTATPTTPYRTTLPSTESGTPSPGTTLPTKFFFGAGLITILIGAVLILF